MYTAQFIKKIFESLFINNFTASGHQAINVNMEITYAFSISVEFSFIFCV